MFRLIQDCCCGRKIHSGLQLKCYSHFRNPVFNGHGKTHTFSNSACRFTQHSGTQTFTRSNRRENTTSTQGWHERHIDKSDHDKSVWARGNALNVKLCPSWPPSSQMLGYSLKLSKKMPDRVHRPDDKDKANNHSCCLPHQTSLFFPPPTKHEKPSRLRGNISRRPIKIGFNSQ